jgi:hypothetical protein
VGFGLRNQSSKAWFTDEVTFHGSESSATGRKKDDRLARTYHSSSVSDESKEAAHFEQLG